jgi:hypothetical protein
MADRYVRMNILSSGGDDAKKTLDDLAARARLLEAESPDLKITADDTKASATIKDLQLKIELLNRMRAEVSFETKGDEAAKAKLLEVDAKLRDLSEKVAKPDIKMQGVDRAEADLIKIKLLMDDIHNKSVDIKLKDTSDLGTIGKLFARLFGGSGGSSGGSEASSAESGTGSGLLSALGGANNEYFGGAIAGLLALAGSVAPSLIPFGLGSLTGIGGAVGAGYLASSANSQLSSLKSSLAGITGNSAADKKDRAKLQAEIAAFEKSHASELSLYSSGKGVVNLAENSLFSALTQNATMSGRSGNRTGGTQEIPGTSFIAGLSDLLKQVSGWIKTIGPSLGDMFRTSLPFLDAFVKILEQFAAAVLPAVTVSMKEFQPYLPQMVQAFKLLSQGVADFIVDLGPGMKDGMIVFKAVMEAVKGILIGLAYTFDGLAIGFVKIGEAAEWEAQRLHEKWDEIRHDTAETFDFVRHLIASDWDNVYNDTIGFALKYITRLSEFFQDLLHGISSTFDNIRHDVAARWDATWSDTLGTARSHISEIGDDLSRWWDATTSGFDNLRHSVAHIWDLIWGDLHNAAVSGVGHLTSAVHGIIGAFETPVKFVVDNVWDKLANIWNSIQGVVHVGFKLPVVHMATGGRIPGYGGGDTVPALLERGEVVVDKDRASMLAPVFKAAGVPGFSSGGVIGGIGSFFSDLGKDILGWITKPLSFITSHVFGAVTSLLPKVGDSGLGSVLKTLVTDVIKSLSGTLHTQGASVAPYTGAYGPGVAQWRPDVLRVLSMLGLPSSDAGTVLAQMMTESGGNPNAINLTDSNAAAGDPSRGLMQTIMTTFEAYRSRSLPNDIYNPLANIFAGVNYAIHRYGNPGWLSVLGHGHGYANGGWITEPIAGVGLSSGMRYALGENGPEYVSPAGRYGSSGGGDVYNIYPPESATNPDAYALTMIKTIRRYKDHHGGASTGIG